MTIPNQNDVYRIRRKGDEINEFLIDVTTGSVRDINGAKVDFFFHPVERPKGHEGEWHPLRSLDDGIHYEPWLISLLHAANANNALPMGADLSYVVTFGPWEE